MGGAGKRALPGPNISPRAQLNNCSRSSDEGFVIKGFTDRKAPVWRLKRYFTLNFIKPFSIRVRRCGDSFNIHAVRCANCCALLHSHYMKVSGLSCGAAAMRRTRDASRIRSRCGAVRTTPQHRSRPTDRDRHAIPALAAMRPTERPCASSAAGSGRREGTRRCGW